MPIDAELLEILACPACKTPVRLVKDGAALKCDTCHRVYAIKDDIPVMLLDEAVVEPCPGRKRVHERGDRCEFTKRPDEGVQQSAGPLPGLDPFRGD